MNYIKVKPKSIKQIRSMANFIREVSNKVLGENEEFPILEFIEKVLQKEDEDLYIGADTKEKMGDNHGITNLDENSIIIREDVYENALKGNGRDRFTIAHELGHYLMHTKEDAVFTRSNVQLKAYENSEWQANTFASELLMPEYLITDEDTVFTLMSRFGVTSSAAKVRLSKLRS
ncbi:MAG TPA: hypothetical protein DDY58_01210 [Terrisporobacter glycolicus]|uniref:ImmA/IrrE family metallo-endopeptidase n=1 Tax=Terrisporobacter TaxID=1505652 RepID=UPI000E823CEB|nr:MULTISPECIES: ImmA/IrrE family metallo-endopeptidase [Terrisporobacter]HBI91148.1 hypothetical protein [Terrisporobacter hibernicus]